mgnify:CR=1 FL=1
MLKLHINCEDSTINIKYKEHIYNIFYIFFIYILCYSSFSIIHKFPFVKAFFIYLYCILKIYYKYITLIFFKKNCIQYVCLGFFYCSSISFLSIKLLYRKKYHLNSIVSSIIIIFIQINQS